MTSPPTADATEIIPSPVAIREGSRLTLAPLTVVPEGDEFLVGDPQSGVFLSIPEVGVVALQKLRAGGTIEEATVAASAFAGEPVNVLEFAGALISTGLVRDVDGVFLQGTDPLHHPRWFEGLRPEFLRPFFSAHAWAIYLALLFYSTALFLLFPSLWPSFEDWLFYPNPALCTIVVTALSLLLAGGHELSHWLAARAEGVQARFAISRRMFFPVFETDLSQLWGVPRNRRYSPFLAGLAFNTVLLAAALSLKLAWLEGADVPPLIVRLAGVIVLLNLLGIGFQALVFLRTDLYAVLINFLGCKNLYRINYLSLKRKVARLRSAEVTELAEAHPRDTQVARWFVVLYAAGLAWATWYFAAIFFPSFVIFSGWMFHGLSGLSIRNSEFWEVFGIAALFGLQSIWPLAVFARERMKRSERSVV